MPNPSDTTGPSTPPGLSWPPPPHGVFDGLAAALPHGLALLDAAGVVVWGNAAFTRLTGYGAWDSAGRSLTGLLRLGAMNDTPSLEVGEAVAGRHACTTTVAMHRKDGQVRWVDLDLRPLSHDTITPDGQLALLVDVTDRVRFEERLALAERMAAIGTLATGVAHEIATPVQFVGDSVQFLRDAVRDVTRAMDSLRQVRAEALAGGPVLAVAEASITVDEDTDVDYLLEHMPRALDSCVDGLDRVGTILKSLKEYAHPQNDTMTRVDLNATIERTLTLARNEYKYVADVDTQFGTLPEVRCVGGSIAQVVLNLVVNAAHAIGDVVTRDGGRGTIAISTRHEGEHVDIVVRDTGGGIPEAVQARIFEPFFTTKAVGKGTGQGLALAWRIIVEMHGGSIGVESAVGTGTTFHVRIPVAGPPAARSTQVAA